MVHTLQISAAERITATYDNVSNLQPPAVIQEVSAEQVARAQRVAQLALAAKAAGQAANQNK